MVHAVAQTPAAIAGCLHCGLTAPAGSDYCCFGCELAAKIREDGEKEHEHLHATFNLSLVLSMAIMMLSLFLYAEDVFDAHGDTELAWMRSAYRALSAILATPVMALAGYPLLEHAWARLKRGQISMEALIAGGAISAYGVSIISVLDGSNAIYFESATAAIVLTTLGRYLEANARSKASRTLGPLLQLARRPVWVMRAGGVSWARIAPGSIGPGDRVRVPIEDTVPADLSLSADSAEVDLGVLTGESKPQHLLRGARVPAGAVVLAAPPEGLEGIAQNSARESTAEKLALLAKSLREQPSASMRWADRLARSLTPIVLLVAAGTALYWGHERGFETAMINALAVVLVACPCTYGVVAPLVHWLVLERALKIGALVRSPEVIERLDRTRTVAFDKTGTLTSALAVRSMTLLGGANRAPALAAVSALEQGSKHPIARALAGYANVEPLALGDRKLIPGAGVSAIDERGHLYAIRASTEAGADVELAIDGAVAARFAIDEQLKPEAPAALGALRALGYRVVILSGDRPDRVARIAEAVEVDKSSAHGGLSPASKAERLAALGEGVTMIGDGLNDAPAVAGVSASIAVGGATDLLRGLADVTLDSGDLNKIPELFALARRAMSTVRTLIFCSTLYNVVFVALAAAGVLRPVFAGASMLIASLLALAFAARLQSGVEEAPC